MTTALAASGQPLPAQERGFFERGLGADLSTVRLHDDPSAHAAAAEVRAKAFTVGADIFFGAGQHQPASSAGRRLLAHELAHTLQRVPSLCRQLAADPTRVSIAPAAAQALSDEELLAEVQRLLALLPSVPAGSLEHQGLAGNIDTLEAERSRRAAGLPVPILADVSDPSQALEVGFEVEILDEAQFEAMTGLTAAALPENVIVSGTALASVGEAVTPERLIPGLATGMVGTPMISYPLPPNATGIQWTQIGAGHLSQFAQVEGATSIHGYRGTMLRHGIGTLFPRTLNRGVPGAYRWDPWYRWMPNQTLVWRPTDAATAGGFAQTLGSTEHGGTYRFPPRPGEIACPGGNCISIPRAQIVEALGGQAPEIVLPGGQTADITQVGRPRPGAPFEPAQAGRGATVREWLSQPDSYFQQRGLTRTRVPNATIAGRAGVAFLKAGGVVLMIYGAHSSVRRILDAPREQQGRVAAQEAGSWIGGLLLGALGSAGAAAVVCSPTGPITFACAAAGFAGGLIAGAVGSAAGAALGDILYDLPEQAMRAAVDSYTEALMQSDDPQVRTDGAALRRVIYQDDPFSMMYLMNRMCGGCMSGF